MLRASGPARLRLSLGVAEIEMPPNQKQDRLEAWYDGSAICVIAVGSHGDPLDLGEEEVEAFITELQRCLREARGQAK